MSDTETNRDVIGGEPEREMTESIKLHEEAHSIFPGGVSHDIRCDFDPYPFYVTKATDSRVWDVDGNEYVDFWNNHHASVLGHSHPNIVEAVKEQAEKGLHYGFTNEKALRLGQKVREYVPSVEQLQFCVTGTEATMYAARLARAHTGGDYILKAEGGWHGGNSEFIEAVHVPFDEPATNGLAPGVAEHLKSFPVNDQEAVLDILEAHRGNVAAVILEPMLGGGGGLECDEEFLQFLEDASRDFGFAFILDEVVTGFRTSPGSYQARVGVSPDLTTVGKFLGGGLAVGAVGGRSEFFEAARPDIGVPAEKRVSTGGGTFSANPLMAAAGLAALEVVEAEPVYEYIESQGERIREGLRRVFDDLGVECRVLGMGSFFMPHFKPETSLDTVYDIEARTDRRAIKEFHNRVTDRGYAILPGHLGNVSYQTTEEEIDGFLQTAEAVSREMKSEGIL